MNASSLKKHLCFGGAAVALCALALAARAQYSSNVLSLNPILYYHLNDTTPVPGNVWTNAGTAGAAGTLFGLNAPFFQVLPGALAAEPANGGAGFSGPGVNSYAPLPYSALIDPSKGDPHAPFTIEGWYNPGSASPANGDGVVINYINMGGRSGWILYQDATVGWDWRIYANSGGTFAARLTSGTNNLPVAGTYYHVVLVWDGTNASMYTNGVQADGPTPAPTFVPIGYDSGGNAMRMVSLGIRTDFNYEWSGSAQEVAVYTNALSAATILAHYQNGINPAPAQKYESLVLALNPLTYWRLNDPGYTSTTGVLPVPFQPGQPLAHNLGSLGAGYDATYEPGCAAAVAGVPYAGFGSNSYSVEFHGLGDAVTGDYGSVQIPALTNITSAANFTFTCWFYNDSFQAGGSPLMWQRSAADNATSAMGLWMFDASQLETMWNDQDYGAGFGNQDPPVAGWNFVSSVWTPTNTTIYLNGVAKSIINTNHAPRDFSVGPILMGADIYNDQNVNGRIQEAAMFTTALTAAQIQSLYNAAQPLPQIASVTQTPPGPVNYEGQSITFNVAAFGDGALADQWLFNGAILTNQHGTNLVISNAKATNSGNYSVVVTNVYGAVTSSPVTLVVLAGPPIISQQPAPAVTLYPNATITLAVAAEGTVPLTYQWLYGTNPIVGATATSLTLAGVDPNQAGAYSVVVTNPHGTLASSNEVLTVIPAPTNYPSAVMALGPAAYWPLNETSGTNVNDYAGGYNGAITGGVALGKPGPALPGLGAGNTAFVLDGVNGVVTTPFLVNGDEGTFVALADVTGTAYVPGILDARGGPGSSCSMELYTDALTLQYTWDNQADTYAYPPTVNMSGLQATANTWCFLVVSVGRDGTIMYVDDGTGLKSETNSVPPFPVTNTGPMLIGRDPTWAYFPGGIDQAAYFNRALTPAEVTALDKTLFTGVPLGPPSVAVQPLPRTVSVGSEASFTVTMIGAWPFSFQWQFNSNNIPGATAQTLIIPSVNATNAGFYRVVVSNALGSATSQSAQLAVTVLGLQGNVNYDLVAHYRFDGDCTDSSGHGHDGIPFSSPPFVAGKIGTGAIQVNVDNSVPLHQFVSCGDPADFQFNPGDSFSVSLWLNYTGTPGDLPIIGNAVNSTYQAGWVLADGAADASPGNLELSFASGTGDYTAPAASTINDGTWHHVAMVADLLNNVAVLYVDSVRLTAYYLNGKGSPAPTLSIPSGGIVNPGYQITIGSDPTGGYQGSSAGGYTIDDVGIWHRALTAAEVGEIFTTGNSGKSFDTITGGAVPLAATLTGTGQLQITWTQGTLQSAPTVVGPWTPVTGATPPSYEVMPTGTAQFYRVH